MLVPMRFQLRVDFPRHVRLSRAQRRMVWVIFFGYVLAFGGFFALSKWRVSGMPMLLLPALVGYGPMILGSMGLAAIRRREKQQMLDDGLLLCCTCRQPVIEDGDGENVRCPECGLRETRERLRALWESAYKTKLPELRTVNARVEGRAG